ncbi:MAG: hypothetical protein LBI04_06025 [Treponema sp.]|jgi:hypothetical protein|nr:hypothetical protein [Treponema sp.]
MEFVRQVVNSNSLTSVLNLPPSFRGVKVEVIVLPVDDKILAAPSSVSGSDNLKKPVKHSAFGRLKAYANPSLIPKEKGAWEMATAEKYALH